MRQPKMAAAKAYLVSIVQAAAGNPLATTVSVR